MPIQRRAQGRRDPALSRKYSPVGEGKPAVDAMRQHEYAPVLQSEAGPAFSETRMGLAILMFAGIALFFGLLAWFMLQRERHGERGT